MHFQIVGDISNIETIATSSGIREIKRLRKAYGRGRWRKRKGNEDYLYPKDSFVEIALPQPVRRAVLEAA